MAIYQFYLAVIPEKGVLEYFGEIPDKLEFDEGKGINEKFDYFEMLQHQCWSLVKINPEEIIKEIDQKLNRANWGNEDGANNWKTETKDIDLDAWILVNEKQNEIQEFTFRADLRQPQLKFLCEMVELADKNELLLLDRKGNLIKPEIGKIIELIKKSKSHKFVQNPIKFLVDFSGGKIEME